MATLAPPKPMTFALDRGRLGMAMLILSESVFFLFLILAYIILHRHIPAGAPSARSSLHTGITAIFTACLLSSSLTLHLAERALRRAYADAAAPKPSLMALYQGAGWLLLTIVLGATFLAGQVHEYYGLYQHNVGVSRDLFATSFFTLTGFHGLHVFIGLVALTSLTVLVLVGSFRRLPLTALEAFGWYWHFVDAIWVVLFSIIYLHALHWLSFGTP